MNATPERTTVEPIPCRWKHIRGEVHDAIYRASCGRARPCPGHLGDLGYDGAVTAAMADSRPLFRGWVMEATPVNASVRTAFYRGFSDSGFRVAFGGNGKRTPHGTPIGRRPKIPHSLFAVQGQIITPTDRIWCPVCGTLNQLDWPDALRDGAAP